MSSSHSRSVIVRLELVRGEFANDLEHREPRVAPVSVAVGAVDEAVVTERRQARERVDPELVERVADCLDTLRCPSLRRRPRGVERMRSLWLGQQLVAPLHRASQRALASREIRRPLQQRSGSRRTRRSRIASGANSFTRARRRARWRGAISSSMADLGDRRRVRVGDGETCPDSGRPVDEQGDRVVPRQRGHRRQTLEVREIERIDRVLALGREMGSGARLVTRIRSRGDPARSSATSGAAERTCSKLSSTRRTSRSAVNALTPASRSRSTFSRTPERSGGHRRHDRTVVGVLEGLMKKRPISEVRQHLMRDGQREPRLARSARPDQRYQPMLLEERRDFNELALASD